MNETPKPIEKLIYENPLFLRTLYTLAAPNNIPQALLTLSKKPENIHSVDDFYTAVRASYETIPGTPVPPLAETSARNYLRSTLLQTGIVNIVSTDNRSPHLLLNFSIDTSVTDFLKTHLTVIHDQFPLATFAPFSPGPRNSPTHIEPSTMTQNFLNISYLVSRFSKKKKTSELPITTILGDDFLPKDRDMLNYLIRAGFLEGIRGRSLGRPTIAYKLTDVGLDTAQAIQYIASHIPIL